MSLPQMICSLVPAPHGGSIEVPNQFDPLTDPCLRLPDPQAIRDGSLPATRLGGHLLHLKSSLRLI